MGYRSRVIGPMHRYFWRFKLTPAGRFVVIGLLVSSIGLISVEIPTYQVFCGLLGLLMICEPIGLMFRPHLNLTGRLPEKARVDEQVTTNITVTNSSLKPAFDLMPGFFGLPKPVTLLNADQYVPALFRGETTSFPVTLVAHRRGVYRLPPLQVHSTFPFNLMRFGGSRLPAQSITVLPRYHTLEHIDIPLSHRYQPGGILVSANTGESLEYIGNREYVPGDPARHLNFRAWARLGRPVVREFQEEYSCRVAVILDTYVPQRRGHRAKGFANLEAAVSLTAATAEALSTGDFLIDFFAAGPNLHVFRSTGSRSSFDSVLEILAAVDVSREDPFAQVSPAVAEEMQQISTAVCIFLDWDDARRELTDRILEAGCALKVIVVRDGETTLPLEESAQIQQVHIDAITSGSLRQI
ncbi:MAG: DUF58 domain-containing protein [Planctomycetaceae bacterium]|nr:DUF58 domain-containing protein [Planctomycetaceae bacterium]